MITIPTASCTTGTVARKWQLCFTQIFLISPLSLKEKCETYIELRLPNIFCSLPQTGYLHTMSSLKMCARIKYITYQLTHRFVDQQGIPDKGKLLTQISLFWFHKLAHIIPNHVVTANVDEMPEEVRKYKDQIDGRSILVKKAEVIPLEAIVRGYITGMQAQPLLRSTELMGLYTY